MEPVFMFTGFGQKRLSSIITKIKRLGGKAIESEHIHPSCTHLLCNNASRSEKFLSACAAGIWVLIPCYVEASFSASKWLPEVYFEWSESYGTSGQLTPKIPDFVHNAPQRCRLMLTELRQKLFANWTVALFLSNPLDLEAYRRILEFGGAKVVTRYKGSSKVTLILADEKSIPLVKKVAPHRMKCLNIDYIRNYILLDNPPDQDSFHILNYVQNSGFLKTPKKSSPQKKRLRPKFTNLYENVSFVEPDFVLKELSVALEPLECSKNVILPILKKEIPVQSKPCDIIIPKQSFKRNLSFSSIKENVPTPKVLPNLNPPKDKTVVVSQKPQSHSFADLVKFLPSTQLQDVCWKLSEKYSKPDDYPETAVVLDNVQVMSMFHDLKDFEGMFAINHLSKWVSTTRYPNSDALTFLFKACLQKDLSRESLHLLQSLALMHPCLRPSMTLHYLTAFTHKNPDYMWTYLHEMLLSQIEEPCLRRFYLLSLILTFLEQDYISSLIRQQPESSFVASIFSINSRLNFVSQKCRQLFSLFPSRNEMSRNLLSRLLILVMESYRSMFPQGHDLDRWMSSAACQYCFDAFYYCQKNRNDSIHAMEALFMDLDLPWLKLLLAQKLFCYTFDIECKLVRVWSLSLILDYPPINKFLNEFTSFSKEASCEPPSKKLKSDDRDCFFGRGCQFDRRTRGSLTNLDLSENSDQEEDNFEDAMYKFLVLSFYMIQSYLAIRSTRTFLTEMRRQGISASEIVDSDDGKLKFKSKVFNKVQYTQDIDAFFADLEALMKFSTQIQTIEEDCIFSERLKPKILSLCLSTYV